MNNVVIGDVFVYKNYADCTIIIDMIINITSNSIFYHRISLEDGHSTFDLSQPDFHSETNWILI